MNTISNNHGKSVPFAPSRAFSITPNDSTDIVACNLYIGTGGDLKVDMEVDGTITFTGLQAGYHPIKVKRVYATGTTASNIIGLT